MRNETEEPTLTIMSKDQKTITFSRVVALQSNLLKDMLEDVNGKNSDQDEVIQLSFEQKILLKVIDFMQHEHTNGPMPEIPRPVPSSNLADCVP